MKNCINCGHELEDSARFCEECGAKQEEPKKICPSCGKELPGKAKFCSGCGTALNANPATKQSPNVPESPTTSTTPAEKPLPTMISGDVEVSQPDEDTISINIKGVPFNLKLVMGKRYGTDNEIPDFFIGETLVTQALWMTVMGDNPSEINDNLEYPVTNITEPLANSFLIKLQKLTGVKFSLLSRGQWMYAAEGGHKSKHYLYYGSDNLSEVGWGCDDVLHPVKELLPNELGIYDLGGIVNEQLREDDYKLAVKPIGQCKTVEYRGFRIAVNLPATVVDEDQPLAAVLHNIFSGIEERRITAQNEKKEIETELKKDFVRKYGSDKGIIKYKKEDYEKIKKIFPLVAGEGYLKIREMERELYGKEKNGIEWKDFGEYGRDKGKPKGKYDKGDCRYSILNGDTLIIDRRYGRELPYIPFILNTINMEGNFWKLNEEISDNRVNITKLTIDDDIKIIGENCFSGFWNLKVIDLPATLEEIGSDSFAGCNSLEYVTFYNLIRIKENAFQNTSLKAILIPKNVKHIEKGAFENTDLNVVFIPEHCEVEEGAFAKCKNLKK